jgi:hypothetical protein
MAAFWIRLAAAMTASWIWLRQIGRPGACSPAMNVAAWGALLLIGYNQNVCGFNAVAR